MPEVIIGGKTKHFSYSPKGLVAAKRAKRKLSGKKYSSEHIKMARGMMK